VSGAWADAARWIATLAILAALAVVWYQIVSNLTPFGGSFSPAEIEVEKKREVRYATLRKITVGLDILFFVWLVAEGALLVPYLFIHYGFVR
jgi:hypothetical protein